MNKSQLKRCVSQTNDAVREVQVAISAEDGVRQSLQSAYSNMNGAIGGQCSTTIGNSIQDLIRESGQISSNLRNALIKIRQANSDYQKDYKNCEDK